MARIVDLTHRISDGMPVYPDDPAVVFRSFHTVAATGYGVSEITMGTHTGTHVDAPSHCLAGGRSVERLPIDALVGWAEVLDIPSHGPDMEITAADLDHHAARVAEGSKVLLRTGWSQRFGQPEFYTDYPSISEGAALWLTKRKVSLLGLEQPSVHPENHAEVHKALLSNNVVLLESLTNLNELHETRVFLVVAPLLLVGLDGSPARVIAIEGL